MVAVRFSVSPLERKRDGAVGDSQPVARCVDESWVVWVTVWYRSVGRHESEGVLAREGWTGVPRLAVYRSATALAWVLKQQLAVFKLGATAMERVAGMLRRLGHEHFTGLVFPPCAEAWLTNHGRAWLGNGTC